MAKNIEFSVRKKLVELAGTCFWYWNGFYDFLESCGVSRSVRSRYPKETYNKYDVMRNVLTSLEESGDVECINLIISSFYRLKCVPDNEVHDKQRANTLLKEFKELVGCDPIDKEILRREKEKAKQEYKRSVEDRLAHSENLCRMNEVFKSLFYNADGVTPQNRGFAMERLLFDIFNFFEVDHTPSYRSKNEQIDGKFSYEKFDYLVEVKWTSGLTKQDDLAIFDNKIRGKAQSTRGFFLSVNGFDESAISKFSGDAPRIVLMTGDDLCLILEDKITFDDAMKAKVDAIVRKGCIYLPLRGLSCGFL